MVPVLRNRLEPLHEYSYEYISSGATLHTGVLQTPGTYVPVLNITVPVASWSFYKCYICSLALKHRNKCALQHSNKEGLPSF